jgi:hypothetical protein
MKRTALMVSVLLLVMIPMIFVSCSPQKDGWQGEVEEVDGVTIVRNPLEPYYGELAIELEDDLEIGNDEDPNYQFYNVSGVALDSEENIFVLDSGNHRVQKFDKDGYYLLTIGRKGEGPGEFMRLYSVYIDDEDIIYLSDRRRIQIFNNEGAYKKSLTLENRIYDFFIDTDGNLITYIIQSDGEGSKKYLVKYDEQGKIVNRIAEYSDVESVQSRGNDGRTYSFKAYHQYNYWPYLFPISKAQFIYAYPSDYVITTVSHKGEVSLKIEKDEPPQPISSAEKNFIIGSIEKAAARRGSKPPKDVLEASCQFPVHRPFFYGMTVDGAGRIYVRKARSVLDESDQVELDIFSKDGYYLYKAFLSFNPEIIKGGFLYDIFTSEETGEVKIKRYKVMNWDRIEKGI